VRSSRRFLPPAMGCLVGIRHGGVLESGCFARRGVLPIVPAHPQQPHCLGSRSLRPLARAGRTTPVLARRPSQRGVTYTKVCAALKLMPALHSHPVLNRQPPLSPAPGDFIKDYTGVRTRVLGAAWTRGGEGWEGALVPWEVAHPLSTPWSPGRCCRSIFGKFWSCCFASAYPPFATRKCRLVMAVVGPCCLLWAQSHLLECFPNSLD